MDVAACVRASEEYPKPEGARFDYGTAGFRAHASRLESVAFRCGALAAARSFACAGAPAGLVLTASHNPEEDNGVKLASWEAHASAAANAEGGEALGAALSAACPPPCAAPSATVLLARDTRPSGPALQRAAARGAASLGATVVDLGLLTTPAAQLAVRSRAETHDQAFAGHVDRLAEGYAALVRAGAYEAGGGDGDVEPGGDVECGPPLVLDCARGVGFAAASAVAAHPACVAAGLALVPTHGPGDVAGGGGGPRLRLNDRCGADWVHTARVGPAAPPPPGGGGDAAAARWRGAAAAALGGGALHASLDGDADRAVLYTLAPTPPPPPPAANAAGDAADSTPDPAAAAAAAVAPAAGRCPPLATYADGDRIAAFVLACVAADLALVGPLPLRSPVPPSPAASRPLSLGWARTAYANGAAADFVALSAPSAAAVVAPTGVKHLLRAAAPFDVAAYWEPNGHGSLLFSDAAAAALRAAAAAGGVGGGGGPRARAAARLLALAALANPCVGCGLAAVLTVHGLLRCRRLAPGRLASLYADRPSALLAVRVPRRAAFACSPGDDGALAAPPGLAAAVAAAVGERAPALRARAFARPSGTEDAVRVYAEAATQAAADGLAGDVAALVVAAGEADEAARLAGAAAAAAAAGAPA